jgi:hypothetical protein
MVRSLPEWFFGCPYSVVPAANWPHLGSPGGLCIEHALQAHPNLPGTYDEILKQCSLENGHTFFHGKLQ